MIDDIKFDEMGSDENTAEDATFMRECLVELKPFGCFPVRSFTKFRDTSYETELVSETYHGIWN